ncbi:universal stress protein [Haliangium sp.]|uniref:universal stress protein n=1 Tax=Haliangium sp. TaxID=2663208 RepID=UPI003D0D71FC
MALHKILVAIDFSAPSRAAFERAVLLAERTGAGLELLWVEDTATTNSLVYGTATQEVERLMAELQAESSAQLGKLAEEARARGVEIGHRVEQGHPDEVIVATADDIGADLVLTGTKGLTGLKRFLLGSVAENVARACHTNVLVTRGDAAEYRRVLVATDFSPTSEKALTVAMAVAAPDAEIDLFHAWQYPPGTHGLATPTPRHSDPVASLHEQIIELNTLRGEALRQRFGNGAQTLRFLQDHGAPAAVIQQRLEAHPYDLVATGTHGYRGFRRFILGSVAEATVRHAPCSVLVAHGGDDNANAAEPA